MGWHVIAKQEVHNDRPTGWFMVPGALMTIPGARAAYDRGEIEMATRRKNAAEGFVINELVVWPRKNKAERPPWFARWEYDASNVRHPSGHRVEGKKQRMSRGYVRNA